MVSLAAIARLVRADIQKLSRYWVVVSGYLALLGFALSGAFLMYFVEQTSAVISSSGWDFAISLMFRYLDFGTMLLFVMLCLLFSIEVSNSTIKYILTRGVTRTELIISKHVTAALMTLLCVAILWAVALGAGLYCYGLGSLTENEYVIFEAGYLYKQIFVATLYVLIPFAALAALAVMVSSFSSTMGGAIIVGLILYTLLSSFGLIPASLGIHYVVDGQQVIIPFGIASLPTQVLVPMYILADVPTGIPVDRWWNWDIQKMTMVSGLLFLVFFFASVAGVKNRDFNL